MKFQLLLASLLGIAMTQNGYSVGSTSTVTLPGSPAGTIDSTGGQTTGSSVTVPTFPAADILKLNGGSINTKITNQNTFGTINNAKKQLSTPVQSIEALFTRLPSKSELDKFANDGDTAAILTTLKSLAADDSVPCGTKISYLLELLGSVKGAIARKNLAADELTAIIDGAKAEIARLQGEIARTQAERAALNIPDIEARIADLVAKLNNYYNQINAIKAQIPPEEARIAGYEKELATLTKQNDGERNRISNDKLKLTQTDNLIKDLQQRLKDAQDQKAALEASIAASEQLIRDNNVKIGNIRTTIADIAAKIKSLQDQLDSIKRTTNTLEVDLERARTDLSVAQVKDRKLADDIKNYTNKIRGEEPKLVDDELKKLRVIIDKLQTSVPQIQSEIDREYYYCYGAGKVETITTGNTIVYVVKGEAFASYVDNAYGQSVGGGNLRTTGDYRLQVVDPFSRAWTSKFGFPWSQGAASGSDFACWNSAGSSSSGRGRISKVNNNGFSIVDGSGKTVNLRVGSCSRVESTSFLPEVGQTLAWRGVPSSAGGYNIYSATCWN